MIKEVPPKKPLTAYFLFLGDERQQIMKNNPASKISEITQIAARMWMELDEKKKEEYQKRNQALQKEYEIRKREYEAKYGEIKTKQRRKKNQSNDDILEQEKRVTKKIRK
ncbi:unnamed protein product [Paramecium sonneborni]|uniref:HMG box domain-containing protein n=1 Tax=Paramecium sonneborni TaxID=65129 RepID=A0A8S1QXS7_9CILI|nr:unnamed protein product [Paramecium sonneborni]